MMRTVFVFVTKNKMNRRLKQRSTSQYYAFYLLFIPFIFVRVLFAVAFNGVLTLSFVTCSVSVTVYCFLLLVVHKGFLICVVFIATTGSP